VIDVPARVSRNPHRSSKVSHGVVAAAVGPGRAIGMRMALDPGRPSARESARDPGHRSVPTRSALMSAATCVTGLVAVAGLGASVTHLLATPRLSGASYDAAISAESGDLDAGQSAAWAEQMTRRLGSEPGVDAVAATRSGELRLSRRGGPEDESVTVQGDAVSQREGSLPPVVRAGRSPGGPGEVALGSGVAESLGVDLDDRVHVRAPGRSGDLRVVGMYVSPGVDDVDRSALLSDAGFDRLLTQVESTEVRVRFADDVDVDAAVARLGREYVGISRWRVPSSVDNLDELGGLPWAVAAFLAVLAVAACVHTLVCAVRVWRRGLSVLRALGFVPGQVRAAVRWQALTMATLGLVAGVPLGLATTRLIWSTVADSLGVVDERVIPWPALGAITALTLTAAVVLAVPPGVVAARTHVADGLRSE
jgi:ABC-type lipoprotein release transport system permease subunit